MRTDTVLKKLGYNPPYPVLWGKGFSHAFLYPNGRVREVMWKYVGWDCAQPNMLVRVK